MGWTLNGNRVERPTRMNPERAIDQQPFDIAFLGTSPLGGGCLVQHGNWPGRTTPPPSGFWPQVRASGRGQVYPLPALSVGSQVAAFNVVVERI